MGRIRIVGGRLGGRRFDVPIYAGTRPTSERVREALASALDARGCFEGARVLDLFAGTGALSFEALSRGATSAVLVENDRRVSRALRSSATSLGLDEQVVVLPIDAFRPKSMHTIAAKGPYDLVFADPPYALAERLPEVLAGLRASLAPGCRLALEHGGTALNLPSDLGLAPVASYRYGDTSIELWESEL